MEYPKNLAGSLARVVFTPTTVAYGWLFLGYARSGLVLFVLFMLAAYRMRLFEGFRRWPAISRVALISGGPLICLGVFFSTLAIAGWMIVPMLVYVVLSVFGYAALMDKSYDSSADVAR